METKLKKIKNQIVKNAKIVESTQLDNNETVENRVEFEIQKFDIVDSKIAEMKSNFKDLKIAGVDDKEGIKKMSDALSIVRNLRTSVEKKRKELKDFYLNTGKGIDAEAKRIQDLIAEIEEPLKEKKKEIDDEIQLIKEQEEAAEQKILDDKVESLKEAGIEFDGNFYSIGENISVDLVSIKELDEEAFEKLRRMVVNEKKRIDNEIELQKLHENRKEILLPFWSFLTTEMQNENFSGLSKERFNEILDSVKTKKEDFDKIQENQKAEAERQIQERKDLNFEKRSFRFEKEGFEVREDGVYFINEVGTVMMSKKQIEDATNPEFESQFAFKIGVKTKNEEELKRIIAQREEKARSEADKKVEDEKEKAIEEKTNQRLLAIEKLNGIDRDGEIFIGEKSFGSVDDLVYLNDSEFLDFTIEAQKEKSDFEAKEAKKQEEERLAKLPEMEKIERYCEEILKINLPELKTIEAQNEIRLLHGEIKRSVEKTLSNIKTI